MSDEPRDEAQSVVIMPDGTRYVNAPCYRDGQGRLVRGGPMAPRHRHVYDRFGQAGELRCRVCGHLLTP